MATTFWPATSFYSFVIIKMDGQEVFIKFSSYILQAIILYFLWRWKRK